MNSIGQEILQMFKTLDDTEKEAFIATAAARVAGASPLQATAAGNIVRLGADHEPIPLWLVQQSMGNAWGFIERPDQL